MLLQTLNGLSFGALLLLVASGFTLVFGLMRIVDLAHGAFFLLGGYAGIVTMGATGNLLLHDGGRGRRGGRSDSSLNGCSVDVGSTIVRSATPANVDTVIIDGRVLKRGGRLTVHDADEVVREASAAADSVRDRAGGRLAHG